MTGPVVGPSYPDGMFVLIELFVKLLILPFKLVWELIELLAHGSHRSHRRHPARRAPQYSQPYVSRALQPSSRSKMTTDDWLKIVGLTAGILIVCVVLFVVVLVANS